MDAPNAQKKKRGIYYELSIMQRAAILFCCGLRGGRQNSVEAEINRFGSIVIVPAIA
jgi:hypothetical protein